MTDFELQRLDYDAVSNGRMTETEYSLKYSDNLTMGDLAAIVLDGQTFDFAVPLNWVNQFKVKTAGIVWLYDGIFGRPFALTGDGQRELDRVVNVASHNGRS